MLHSDDHEKVVPLSSVEEMGKGLREAISDLGGSFNAETLENTRENTRHGVARLIIGTYAYSVFAIILFGCCRILFYSGEDLRLGIAALKEIVGFMNVLVLPVITLVLGFYYGSEKR